jgi:FkbM family methyltransferase
MRFAERTISALHRWPFLGQSRLLGWLLPCQGTRRADVFGCRVELDLGDRIQRSIYLGTYERKETRLVRRYLRPGMTVVDVGANVGYYTLLAARRVGAGGQVFAFEPSAYAADLLERTVQANRLTQVRVVRSGLGSRPGEARLAIPAPGNHTPSMLGTEQGPATTVAVTTLDQSLTDFGIERVDLLKLDVEGYEPQVLAGGAAALAAGRVGAILCELNDPWLRHAGTDAQALYDTLLQAGFVDFCAEPPPLAGSVWTRLLVHHSAATAYPKS